LLVSTSIFAIWDDHEVFNDFAGQTVDQSRYDNGRQAFLEYIPLRNDNLISDPSCAGDPLFRVFSWGEDIEIIILDERSCRSESAIAQCPFMFGIPDLFPTLPPELRSQYPLVSDNPPDGCLESINDPGRTMLGQVQKQVFLDTLLNSTARYKFVINEVPIQQLYFRPYDRWEGYSAEREEILNFIKVNNIKNVIFLTGDLHANVINEVFIDHFNDPEPIGMEFVTGPIATHTFEENIPWIVKSLSLNAVNDIMNMVGVDCRDLNVYSYGLVEIDSFTGIPTITLKDETGRTLVDTRDQVTLCKKTLGSTLFLPTISKAFRSQSYPH
jgi:phosphodiesterase/alkaline phosphatase D-like protein